MSKRFAPDQEKEICRLYFEDRLSSYRLAERFGCSPRTIRRIIKRYGFKLRPISEANKGRANGNWRGGRMHCGSGYIGILKPNHPNASMLGYVREHRLIMEEHLGRFLNPEEVVHHINDIRDDNRIENLMLFVKDRDHQNWHGLQKKRTGELLVDFRG